MIIADTLNENIVDDSDDEVDDSDDEAEAISSVTLAQACSAFDTVLEWLESEGGVDSSHLLLIKKWRNIAAMKHLQKLKQKYIHFLRSLDFCSYYTIINLLLFIRISQLWVLSYRQF